MYKKIILMTIVITSISLAQTKLSDSIEPNFGFYGGLSVSDDNGGIFFIEGKKNIMSNISLKGSIGYNKTFENTNRPIKAFDEFHLGDNSYYNSKDFNITKHTYDILMIAAGFNIKLVKELYVVSDITYNIISKKEEKQFTAPSMQYSSFDELPIEYRDAYSSKPQDNTIGFNVGLGYVIPLSSSIYLDFRYIFRYVDEIVNSHNVVIGINI